MSWLCLCETLADSH